MVEINYLSFGDFFIFIFLKKNQFKKQIVSTLNYHSKRLKCVAVSQSVFQFLKIYLDRKLPSE